MEKDKTENHRGKYMNLLTMEHVSKAYTDRVLLDDVGFGINKNEKIGYGPRGLKPIQFPCCPCDKQRNVPGKEQLIFWDSGLGCYRCSRGHKFKINGKLF